MILDTQKVKYYYIRNGTGIIINNYSKSLELSNIELSETYKFSKNNYSEFNYSKSEIFIEAVYSLDNKDFFSKDIELCNLLKEDFLEINIIKNELEAFFPIHKVVDAKIIAVDLRKNKLYIKAKGYTNKEL